MAGHAISGHERSKLSRVNPIMRPLSHQRDLRRLRRREMIGPGETAGTVDHWGRSILVFLSGFALAGSLTPWTRPEVGGFLLHPYLLFLGIMLVMGGLRQLVTLDRRVALVMLAYFALFTIDSFQGGFNVAEPLKVAVAVFTIWAFATLLRSRDEVVLAALGGVIAVGVVALPSILNPSNNLLGDLSLSGGFGNKNTYSLYALPMILLGLHFSLEVSLSKRMRILFAAGAALATIGILSTGNRSGYVGLVVIILLVLLRRRRLRDVILVSFGSAVTFLMLTTLGSTQAFWFRLSYPDTSRASDELRVLIVQHALSIGYHNPFLGVGPGNVGQAIATSVGYGADLHVIGPLPAHNVWVYNFAGGGFPLAIMLAVFLGVMMLKPLKWNGGAAPTDFARDGLAVLQSMVILFAIRGYFTEEAFITPGFPIAFGILLALLAVEGGDADQIARDRDDAQRGPEVEDSPQPQHRDLFAEARSARDRSRRTAT